jgi:RHS repeat-associated protein
VNFRGDFVNGVYEGFGYDELDRLKKWFRSDDGGAEVLEGGWGVTYGYDDRGNMTSRQVQQAGAGMTTVTQDLTYEYDGTNNAGPHAATKLAGLWANPFRYDLRGNVTQHPEGWELKYTPFNLPSRIHNGALGARFAYDAFQGRALKEAIQDNDTPTGDKTVYVGGIYEKRKVGNDVTHVFYVAGAERVVAQVTRTEPGATETTTYLHADNLGSTEATRLGAGALSVTKRDPFGNKVALGVGGGAVDVRLSATAPGTPVPSAVTLGYTGHEMDDEFGFVNMGGRIMDPRLGRFLQMDPTVGTMLHSQALNRYSYVGNNPMKYTDPTGYTQQDQVQAEAEAMYPDAVGQAEDRRYYIRNRALISDEDPDHDEFNRMMEAAAAEGVAQWEKEKGQLKVVRQPDADVYQTEEGSELDQKRYEMARKIDPGALTGSGIKYEIRARLVSFQGGPLGYSVRVALDVTAGLGAQRTRFFVDPETPLREGRTVREHERAHAAARDAFFSPDVFRKYVGALSSTILVGSPNEISSAAQTIEGVTRGMLRDAYRQYQLDAVHGPDR